MRKLACPGGQERSYVIGSIQMPFPWNETRISLFIRKAPAFLLKKGNGDPQLPYYNPYLFYNIFLSSQKANKNANSAPQIFAPI